ncbi:MAG: hypothetical protein AAF601_16200 [Pseudomonadota bacterium]
MKHDLPKHIEGKSGAEITAFTLQAVKSIVEGEAQTERTPLPASQVQQPPHMRGTMNLAEPAADAKPAPVAKPAPEIIEPAAAVAEPEMDEGTRFEAMPEPETLWPEAQAPRKRSLLARLTGR